MQTLSDLAPSIARELVATLCALLPPPAADMPEARADREATAVAAVAALPPPRRPARPDDADIRHCRAQAATVMRHMQGGLRALQGIQARRETREAAMERAGDWVRDASVSAPAAAHHLCRPPRRPPARPQMPSSMPSNTPIAPRASGHMAACRRTSISRRRRPRSSRP
jgi:hypothetical protein